MTIFLRFKFTLFVLALLVVVGLHPFYLSAQEQQIGGKQKTPVATTEEQKITLIELYSWATIIPKKLIDLQNEIEDDNSLATLDKELPDIVAEIDRIRWDTTIAQTNPEIQLPQVNNHQEKTQRIVRRLEKMSDLITSSISSLSATRKKWKLKKEQVLELENTEEIQLLMAAEQYKDLLDTIDLAMSLIEENLKHALQIGKAIGDMQITLYSIESDLQELDQELRSTSIQKTAPSMLSAEFYSRINGNLIRQSYNKTQRFIGGRYKSLRDNIYPLLLGGFAFALLCLIVNKTRDFTKSTSAWHPFARCPLATTVFLASSISAFFSLLLFHTELLQQWEAFLHILTLLAVIRLVKHLVVDRTRQKILKILTFFTIGTLVMLLLGLPHIVTLLYVFYVSVVALIYYFSRLPSTRGKELSKVWINWLWGLFPAMVVVFGISGYDQLAVVVFSTLLSTIITCLVVWMFYLLHLGLLELFLTLLPFSLIKENISRIVDGLQPVIGWLHILILVAIQCVIWDLYPTFNKALYGLLNMGVDFAGIHISPNFIFSIALVIYVALLVSRAIQVMLLKNVLPRYKADRGVQLSIARLVHYAVLSIGFLVLLRVLGFQLNQLTLLGGALGVGIGFGLQAIVNNFASGLILLFERPVKVGDTIQIGTEWGEVKQLGLRATVIQTFDNAEIVVPNSDLITSQVTNWTLGDRRVRVKIPVGVAYGSDVSKVMEILVGCGKANPMVLGTPPPAALFLAFGASSLDFELRVWIPEFLNKLQVLSDLNQDIDYEFSVNGIEIPFPQSDLHLRTVEDEAGARLHGKAVPTALAEPAGESEGVT
ncbi:MAG: mechanosensitive ion channel domain-containing protein [Desulforhopalus sp.]